MNNNAQIAIVVSEFNQEITDALLDGTLTRLAEHHIKPEQITTIKVPGAGEIPLTTKLLARKNKYDAIICLGAVIRGDTDHYDYVCQQVSQGCQQVMMQFDVPVIFYVLMTHNEEQAYARIGGAEGHKGKDAADAALAMINTVNSLR